MSMLCSLYRISPELVTRLKNSPDVVGELLGLTAPPPKVGFLSKLFGKPTKQTHSSGPKFEPVAKADTFELDQAWHILHYLFSGSSAEGPWPSGFVMSGGEEVGPDQGYGPVRLLDPELSRAVATFLDAQSLEKLDASYVVSDIEAAEIYWQASSDDTERQRQRQRQRQVQELWRMVQELRAFFEHTVRAGHATLVSIY